MVEAAAAVTAKATTVGSVILKEAKPVENEFER